MKYRLTIIDEQGRTIQRETSFAWLEFKPEDAKGEMWPLHRIKRIEVEKVEDEP